MFLFLFMKHALELSDGKQSTHRIREDISGLMRLWTSSLDIGNAVIESLSIKDMSNLYSSFPRLLSMDSAGERTSLVGERNPQGGTALTKIIQSRT